MPQIITFSKLFGKGKKKSAKTMEVVGKNLLRTCFFRRLLSILRLQRRRHGTSGDIVNFLWPCRKAGHRGSTIDSFGRVLRHLARRIDINDPDNVAGFTARKNVSEARKEVIMNCYVNYCRWKNLRFEKPGYRRVKKLLFVPLSYAKDDSIKRQIDPIN